MSRHNFSHIFPDIGREGQRWKRAITFDVDCVMGPIASSTADAAPFLMSGTSAGLTIEDDLDGGVAKLLSNSTNQAVLQGNGEPFRLDAGIDTVFEARVKLADADGQNFFVGLAITDTDPFATSLTDYVGFFAVDTSALIKIGCGKDNNNVPGSGTSGETDQTAAVDGSNKSFADDTFVLLQFLIFGTSRVKFFVDQQYAGTINTNLPDNENLTVTFANKGSAESSFFDYIVCAQDRLA